MLTGNGAVEGARGAWGPPRRAWLRRSTTSVGAPPAPPRPGRKSSTLLAPLDCTRRRKNVGGRLSAEQMSACAPRARVAPRQARSLVLPHAVAPGAGPPRHQMRGYRHLGASVAALYRFATRAGGALSVLPCNMCARPANGWRSNGMATTASLTAASSTAASMPCPALRAMRAIPHGISADAEAPG